MSSLTALFYCPIPLFEAGAGNYKRSPKNSASAAAAAPVGDKAQVYFGMASSADSYENNREVAEPNAPEETNDGSRQQEMTYQLTLKADNERLTEINRQQADEIARLRAQLSLSMSGSINREWY